MFGSISKKKKNPPESSVQLNGHDNKRSRRSDCPTKIEFGELKCLFCWEIDSSENLCAAGTMHATSEKVNEKHVQNFSEKLSEKALKLMIRDLRMVPYKVRCALSFSLFFVSMMSIEYETLG